jgi:hypothetical protein
MPTIAGLALSNLNQDMVKESSSLKQIQYGRGKPGLEAREIMPNASKVGINGMINMLNCRR